MGALRHREQHDHHATCKWPQAPSSSPSSPCKATAAARYRLGSSAAQAAAPGHPRGSCPGRAWLHRGPAGELPRPAETHPSAGPAAVLELRCVPKHVFFFVSDPATGYLTILTRNDGPKSMIRLRSDFYKYIGIYRYRYRFCFLSFFSLLFEFFLRITQYNEDAHNTHAHSHPMNTRTQTLPL